MNKFMRILIISMLMIPAMVFVNLRVSHANPDDTEQRGTGWIPLSQEELDSMEEVHSFSSRTVLPAAVDLSENMPKPGDQGQQGSCVAWAVGYSLKSHQEQMERGWGVNTSNHQFSPSYIYNQINDGVDKGSNILDAMWLIQNQGVCSLADMSYREYDYKTQPNAAQRAAAGKFKALDYGYTRPGDVDEMKNQLYNQNPVIIGGIEMYNDFENISKRNPVFDKKDYLLRGGTHAVCLVGYDDNMGAFKFINSWGKGWGIDGYGYISYDMIREDSYYGFLLWDKIDVKEISLNSAKMEVFINDYENIAISVMPNNASIKNVVWSSDNPSVAAVDSNGRVSGVSLGEAVITVRSEDPDAEINTASCHVTVRDGKKFIGYIDETDNTGLNSWMYSLKGWGLYTPDYITDGIKDIKVYMDGTELGTAERTSRPDVQSAHPGYINYENCGFEYDIDTAEFSNGVHHIEVKFLDQTGGLVGLLSKDITVENQAKEFAGHMDSPEAEEISGYTSIFGWGLYTADGIRDGVAEIKVYIDGEEEGTAKRVGRPDVESGYPGYVDYNNCGFHYDLDTTELTNGMHKIEVKFYSPKGRVVGLLSKDITVKNQTKEFAGHMDSPESDAISGYASIFGWGLYTADGIRDGVAEVKVYIDGEEQGTAKRVGRPDVESGYPGYVDYNNCGFHYDLDTTELTNEMHKIEVKFYSPKGRVVGLLSKDIAVKNLEKEFAGYMDSPESEEISGYVSVLGWGLYTADGIRDGVAEVKVYIDGKEEGAAKRVGRPEVEAEYPGYIDYNNCGFHYDLDTTELTNGMHKIEVKFYSPKGRVVGLLSKNITVKNLEKVFAGYMDSPEAEEISGYTSIFGWGLYTPNGIHDGVGEVKVYIDGKEEGTAKRVARPEVEAEYPGYIDYNNCGFHYDLDTTELTNGMHKIEVKFYSPKGRVVGLLSKDITVRNQVWKILDDTDILEEAEVKEDMDIFEIGYYFVEEKLITNNDKYCDIF